MANNINASIITIGDELLIGQTVDTNSAFIGTELNKKGIWVHHRVAVGDVYNDIWNALDQELNHSHIIIITGGLGPTADDITKPLLCTFFNSTLVRNEQVLAHIIHLFQHVLKRKGPMLESNLRQADVPSACTVLFNKWGTAPGMWFETERNSERRIVISLPGVPNEMKGLIEHEVLPRLSTSFTLPVIEHRTLVSFGMGESYVAEKLKEFESQLPASIKLAYLPAYRMLRLRLTAKGNLDSDVNVSINHYFNMLKDILADIVVTDVDETIQQTVAAHLQKAKKTLSLAESCTGGYISHLITSMPGSSQYYTGGVVSYSNMAKQNLLHVPHAVLEQEGAVSEETVKAMAQGALNQFHTDYAIAVSGIMGPDGGSVEKPVGTVWVAVGFPSSIKTSQIQVPYDRTKNIIITATYALYSLLQYMRAEEKVD